MDREKNMGGNKNRFIHDLRNPLNTISVNAELGKLTLERTGDIRKAISIFETILAECRECSHLLDALHNTRFVCDESNFVCDDSNNETDQ